MYWEIRDKRASEGMIPGDHVLDYRGTVTPVTEESDVMGGGDLRPWNFPGGEVDPLPHQAKDILDSFVPMPYQFNPEGGFIPFGGITFDGKIIEPFDLELPASDRKTVNEKAPEKK
jgi:hypothetical protein